MRSLCKAGLLLLCLLPVNSAIYADSADWSLMVKPKKCVSMRQGQVCYQDVNITWRAPKPDNYCVHVSGESQPIKCWKATSQGKIKLEFQGKSSQAFLLRKENSDKDYARSILEVKWVYKSQRNLRTGWRMF